MSYPPRVQHGIDMTKWDGRFPKGWTDPRVVAGIAKGCDFLPVPLAVTAWDVNVFACKPSVEQACVPTTCLMNSNDCRTSCGNVCDTCAAACTTTCDGCEAACTTDTCKQTCAAATGACKDACVRAMDRCQTGECNKAENACNIARDAKMKVCAERCPAVQKCERECPAANDPEAGQYRGACVGLCINSAQDLGCPMVGCE